ncbi:MAG: DMT family transporter [Actinobacteria bacterium]|nr:DMT family transporter [Actinomycetota bacterium]
MTGGAPEPDHSEARGVGWAVLAAGFWSTAGILQAQLTVSPTTQLAGRSLFGFVTLMLIAWWYEPRFWRAAIGLPSLTVSVLTAIASGSFLVALNLAATANVLLIFATGPIVAALLAGPLLGERVGVGTLASTLLALAGVAMMIGTPAGGSYVGDGLALLSTVSFAATLIACRRHPDVPMIAGLGVGQLLILLGSFPFAGGAGLDRGQVGWLVLFGVGQLALGQLFFLRATRLVPATKLASVILLEIVLGPVWVWLAGAERPTFGVLLGGALIILAVAGQTLAGPLVARSRARLGARPEIG